MYIIESENVKDHRVMTTMNVWNLDKEWAKNKGFLLSFVFKTGISALREGKFVEKLQEMNKESDEKINKLTRLVSELVQKINNLGGDADV